MAHTTLLGPKISIEILKQVGYEGKRAEAIQTLADGSQLTKNELQKRLRMSQPGISGVLKDLTMQGVTIETVHYDGENGKRQTRFTLEPKRLCKILNRRAEELRLAALEIEKIYSDPPDDHPRRYASPAPSAVSTPTPAPASPNGLSGKSSSPFRSRHQ